MRAPVALALAAQVWSSRLLPIPASPSTSISSISPSGSSIQSCVECQQLAFAPRQDRHRALGCTTSGDATVPRTRQALLAKNAQVDRLGFWCGFDPELVTETFPKLPVRGDGQSRPPRGGVGLRSEEHTSE